MWPTYDKDDGTNDEEQYDDDNNTDECANSTMNQTMNVQGDKISLSDMDIRD